MKKILGYLALYAPSFILSWLVSYSLASVSHTQAVVNRLNAIGGNVGFAERLSMSLYDWNALIQWGELFNTNPIAGSFGNFIFRGMCFAFFFTFLLIVLLRKLPKAGIVFLPLSVVLAAAIIMTTHNYLWGFLGLCASLGIWLSQKQKDMSIYLFPLAGAASIATVLFSAQHMWGIVPFAGARDLGLIFQLASGALGGLAFVVISRSISEYLLPLIEKT